MIPRAVSGQVGYINPQTCNLRSFALQHGHIGLSTSFPFDVRGWKSDTTTNRYEYHLGPPRLAFISERIRDGYFATTTPWHLSADVSTMFSIGRSIQDTFTPPCLLSARVSFMSQNLLDSSLQEVRLADYEIMRMVQASRDADGRLAVPTDIHLRRSTAHLRTF